MLFWIFVIILAVGIGLIVGSNFLYTFDDEVKIIGKLITVISTVVLAIMLSIICFNYVNIDAGIEKNKEIYNALEYKITSGACRDEFGLLSKEVIDEVQEWNEDVKYYQKAQYDFWVGIFYPNVFDQFETIDYEKYDNSMK